MTVPMLKKYFMMQIWRFQQSYALVGMFGWAILITLTSYQYIAPHITFLIDYRADFGVLLGLVFVFLMVFLGILGIGFAYDRVLKLWREAADVQTERNPYVKEKLTPKEIVLWRHGYLPLLRSTNDASTRADVAFMENWVQRSLDDPSLRQAAEAMERWIASPDNAEAFPAPQEPPRPAAPQRSGTFK